jgi:5-methylcytosine-specific restriction endonuclease McrA
MRLGRDGVGYINARKEVLRDATHCAICGLPLDFDAPARSRWSPSVDHIIPVSKTKGWDDETRKRLAEDPQYMRPAHYGCNSRRGAGGGGRNDGRQSRDW